LFNEIKPSWAPHAAVWNHVKVMGGCDAKEIMLKRKIQVHMYVFCINGIEETE